MTDNKGKGPESRRSVCRPDGIDGGRALEKQKMTQRRVRIRGCPDLPCFYLTIRLLHSLKHIKRIDLMLTVLTKIHTQGTQSFWR